MQAMSGRQHIYGRLPISTVIATAVPKCMLQIVQHTCYSWLTANVVSLDAETEFGGKVPTVGCLVPTVGIAARCS